MAMGTGRGTAVEQRGSLYHLKHTRMWQVDVQVKEGWVRRRRREMQRTWQWALRNEEEHVAFAVMVGFTLCLSAQQKDGHLANHVHELG